MLNICRIENDIKGGRVKKKSLLATKIKGSTPSLIMIILLLNMKLFITGRAMPMITLWSQPLSWTISSETIRTDGILREQAEDIYYRLVCHSIHAWQKTLCFDSHALLIMSNYAATINAISILKKRYESFIPLYFTKFTKNDAYTYFWNHSMF